MQADDVKGHRKYANSFQCARQIFSTEGGVKGLYKGGAATLLREVPGTIAWCGTYDRLKVYMTPRGESSSDLPVWKRMWAGGLAGIAFWTVMFPSDVIKTRIQVDPVYSNYGITKALMEQYKESGMRGLYRGWTMTALRSFPSNAVIFLVFDKVSLYLNGLTS
ncbi:solute carrier family 25 (mitochondrial carnitine/acylcarnitine transporter), member 20/29 [Angomonas deanei]|uniref:Mitochondrial carrier protein, putative n=1 Tax=Angomonas deanei TaxID=59799 RepID=A0A7G2C0D5_9TRYP|nr:solute carrier family 25 (mitochondrial carnitine/acylcarnitine transporter), member 20/29 [Angomonas deanei]CAD2212661.1 Mitochondrial carrier protein, putative [Angomonas deanei]|eukprot:EPY37395.1 solute carrier family 25 (mitochondrial carnitine/acylcarnitine transporter), member 20/29 [Angomonas deanei]